MGIRPSSIFEYEVVSVDSRGKVRDRQKCQAECQTEALGQGINLELVMIPGGCFQMGSQEGEGFYWECPQHPVTVASFWMGKYPVTQAQWKAVAAFDPVECYLKSSPSHFKGDNRPVDRVTWYESEEFCKRLSQKTGCEYRLPSEAEWEYACRAGATTLFHFGLTLASDLENYGRHYDGTTKVGRFGVANSFGLYDMHGNVSEWCLDHWHENYQGAPTDGSAWLSPERNNLRVRHGGSWFNSLRYCRSAHRNKSLADSTCSMVGFRIVCAASLKAP